MINQCIIFDNDGTLVDSEQLCNRALLTLLANYGVTADDDLMNGAYSGWKLDIILATFEAKHHIKLADSFIDDYRQLIFERIPQELQPIPHVREALATINVPICVASSAPMEKIEKTLAVTGLAPFFKGNYFSAYDIKSWKPEPDLFLYAAKTMGFAPEQCAVVEDSAVGVEAALRAGMRPFWYYPHGDEVAPAGVVQFDDMSRLPQLLFGTMEAA